MLSYVCGLLLGGAVLSRRMEGVDRRRISGTLFLLYAVAFPVAGRQMMMVRGRFSKGP